MPEIKSIALNQSIQVDRIIGRIDGALPGPCLVFFAGIHGNEPSGIFALKQVIEELRQNTVSFSGSLIAISGNLWALERGERFQVTDLNRLWLDESIKALENGTFTPKHEDEKQQKEIYDVLSSILKTEKGPFYFFDLHTTSGDTIPFITVNDSLLNRQFTRQYPVPLILGIEEHLNGPLLSYINELGYVSFGFEGGQHNSMQAIENHKIFTYLSLVFTDALQKDQVPFDQYMENWNRLNPDHKAFYEIYDRYEIQADEQFSMKPGFSNFQSIRKGEVLATSNGKDITAPANTTLFMPLYQAKGNDGYFLVKRTPRFFLWLSGILRRFQVDRIFPLLPGVKWSSKEKDTMIVDLRIARFITKQLFHLFGYRSKQQDKKHLLIKNREHKSKTDAYKHERWYRKGHV